MRNIILYGLSAALFFSSTFAINRWLNVEQGGHWFWTAALRYMFVFIILTTWLFVRYGKKFLLQTFACFFTNFLFWIFAGGIGFATFYLLLSYAASHSPGWVLATTWQTTILFTPLVIKIFGGQVEMKGVIYLFAMFIGIILVNSNEFGEFSSSLMSSIIPIVLAALAYPVGNTLCKYACEGRFTWIRISYEKVASNIASQVLMMVMGALPIIAIVGLFVSPSYPVKSQFIYVFVIAILTGVFGTVFLYKARQLAKDDGFALAAADSTQAFEAPLALIWEYLLFSQELPGISGLIGLILLTTGLLLFYLTNIPILKVSSK